MNDEQRPACACEITLLFFLRLVVLGLVGVLTTGALFQSRSVTPIAEAPAAVELPAPPAPVERPAPRHWFDDFPSAEPPLASAAAEPRQPGVQGQPRPLRH
jgi:hypothetical protein